MRRFQVLTLAVCLAVGLAGLFAAPATAQITAGAKSLLITPGPRADGMGQAYVALAESPTSVWWNPGGLAFTPERSATLMHTKLVPGLADDVYYEYLGYSQPLEGVGGFGANIIYLTYGKSTAITDTEQTLGEFTSYEIAGTASLGFQVTPKLGFGAALKYVFVDLAPAWATPDNRDGSGSSFAIDLGLLYRDLHIGLLGEDNLNLALVVTNLGPDISFIDEGQSSPLGRNVKLGFTYELFDSGLYGMRVAYEFDQPIVVFEEDLGFFDHITDFGSPLFGADEDPVHHYGAEFTYAQETLEAAVRLGYIFDTEGDIKDPTFGLGFTLGQFTIDWAMVPQAQSLDDNVHKFAVTASF
jgi:hypothetical protein